MAEQNAAARANPSQIQLLQALKTAGEATLSFYAGLIHYLLGGAYVPQHVELLQTDTRARVQIYSLSLIFYLWDKPHYRNGSFQEDMIKNLRNVAIPGTGVPLSLFCYSKLTALLFVFVALPLVCLFAAFNKASMAYNQTTRSHSHQFHGFMDVVVYFLTESLRLYVEHLLHPPDWFSFWRLNCRLASLHSLKTKSHGYRYEDKWTFLVEGEAKGVPVTPYLKCPALVIKDTNEEGGMGIHFYNNALSGGRWIIQEKIDNSDAITGLLPQNPPLSTVRVITTSTWSLAHAQLPRDDEENEASDFVTAVSSVFRAGRKDAKTDHSSILFDVDKQTGKILRGTTNAHWYQLGLAKGLATHWCSTHHLTEHPDAPGRQVTGEALPDVPAMLRLVVESHFKLLPDVPIVGWDVAYTNEGIMFLEVNLSCNFFRGSFDTDEYFGFVDRYFRHLDPMDIQTTSPKLHSD